MSWALYLRHEELGFSEFIASFTDVEDAIDAQTRLDNEIVDSSDEEEDYLPVVILVEE